MKNEQDKSISQYVQCENLDLEVPRIKFQVRIDKKWPGNKPEKNEFLSIWLPKNWHKRVPKSFQYHKKAEYKGIETTIKYRTWNESQTHHTVPVFMYLSIHTEPRLFPSSILLFTGGVVTPADMIVVTSGSKDLKYSFAWLVLKKATLSWELVRHKLSIWTIE